MESKIQDETSRAQASAQPPPASSGASSDPGASGNQSQAVKVVMDPDEVADAIEVQASSKSIREILADHPAVRALTVASAVRCLRSERIMFDRETKKVITVGDGTTIMKAVAWLSAYSDGLPVQQTVNVNFDANKEMPVKEMLVKSPALRAAFRKQLEDAEREAGDPVQQRGPQKQVGPESGKTT